MSAILMPNATISGINMQKEILRIKSVLFLKRNATRDYLDFVALADYIGPEKIFLALQSFDHLYPQAKMNQHCSNCRYNWRNHYPTTLKCTTSANIRTSTHVGTTGKMSGQPVSIVPPSSSTALLG